MSDFDGFKFQKFVVEHSKCAMKVGTEGVLLGAWVDVNDKKKGFGYRCRKWVDCHDDCST